MTRIAFFDLARRSGAAWDSGTPGKPSVRIIQMPAPDGAAYGPLYAKLRTEALKIIVEQRIEMVGFESAINAMASGIRRGGKAISNPATVRQLGGYCATIEGLAAELGLPCFELPAATIKLHFTGNGRAEKADMLHMCKVLQWDVGDDHNCADAAAGWSALKSLREPGWAPNATRLFGRPA
jgi:hypothetical protein